MNLRRLCLSAVILVAAATEYSVLWGQSTHQVPIVTPDQVVARLQAASNQTTVQDADRPQPFRLESFDFQAQVGSQPPIVGPGHVSGDGAANSDSAVHSQRVDARRHVEHVYRADLVPTALPQQGGVQTASFQRFPDLATVPPAPTGFFGPPPQDTLGPTTTEPAQQPLPLATETVGPEPVSPQILPTAPDAIGPNLQVFSETDSGQTCEYCGGTGCAHCLDPDADTPYDLEQVSSQFDCCGFVSCARHYLILDYLRWDYENTRFVVGNLGGIYDYERADGIRMTYGNRPDCNRGRELSFLGLEPWQSDTQVTSAGGNLNAGLFPFGNIPLNSVSSFYSATFLQQFEQARLHSLEINDTMWGWDVVKAFWGFRYIYFDESLQITSVNNVGQVGTYNLNLTNFLFGPQVGLEMFYDIGYRLSFSFSSKLGGFINLNEGQTLMVNNGSTVINASDEDNSWSLAGEFGMYTHFQILPRVRARLGYDALGLWQVATVSENFTPFVFPGLGSDYLDSDEVFFHGVFAGLEFYR